MNGTEADYAKRLELRRNCGEILWYKFESMTFKLADGCRFTPDFVVMAADGVMEVHEVKGSRGFEDDALVKIKVLAEHFPFRVVAYVAKAKKAGGGWEERVFGD